LLYRVNVASSSGPIDSALVQLVFSDEAANAICWCTGQTEPIIEATTNASGDADFYIAASGCIDPDSMATFPPVEVYANGFWLDDVGTVSPDAVDDAAKYPWQGWGPPGTCITGLSDVTSHTGPLKNGTYAYCTDFDSDMVITLTDAVLATGPFSQGDFCTPAP
jgi:hypothetical protein